MAIAMARRGCILAQINVTPMADVMIVLLIIFMVATPLLREEVPLPRARHALRPDGPVSVTLSRHGLRVNGALIASAANLPRSLREIGLSTDEMVRVRADRTLPYAEISDVLAACREAGAENIALMALAEDL